MNMPKYRVSPDSVSQLCSEHEFRKTNLFIEMWLQLGHIEEERGSGKGAGSFDEF